MHIADRPTQVVTVLGSCLSVTMFSRRAALGAICHGLLPRCVTHPRCDGGCLEGFKYVDCSIRQMARFFDRRGVSRREIEVKYFGGADMFPRGSGKAGALSVGKQNVQTAERILRSEGLRVHASDVGGMRGRKIIFFTATGEVFLKRLTNVNDPEIRW
jgi:chemotaxis protein CheD